MNRVTGCLKRKGERMAYWSKRGNSLAVGCDVAGFVPGYSAAA